MQAINKLASAGMHFWDYGNAFLLEAGRAGEWIECVFWLGPVTNT